MISVSMTIGGPTIEGVRPAKPSLQLVETKGRFSTDRGIAELPLRVVAETAKLRPLRASSRQVEEQ
jgi:hypothetical protein